MSLYDAIFNIPELAVLTETHCTRWAAAETNYGPGIAMYTPETEKESLKLAAANSYWNRGTEHYIPFDRYWADDIDFAGKTVGVVGAMKQIRARYSGIAKKIYVFDFMADAEKDILPAELEEKILPECDVISITGSSIQNGTLPHLLEICKGKYVCLAGPSVPQCEALFDFGISKISGMTIGDAEKMREFIRSDTPGTPYVFGTPFMMRKK